MKTSLTQVPDILKNMNPVTLQPGPVSHDADQMQVPDTIEDIPRAVFQLLTQEEQDICDSATD